MSPVREKRTLIDWVRDYVLNLRDSQLFIVGASKMERSNRALFMTITAALQQP